MGREISYHAGGRGRDGSCGQGQSGPGRGSQDNKPKMNNGSSKPPEAKFIPHRIGKERQTVTYQTVKDYIIQLVQKSFRNGKDLTDSLRKMKKIDMTKNMPRRKILQKTNNNNKAVEQQGYYDILYKAEIDMYTKRKH
jgi:hypothetical protein